MPAIAVPIAAAVATAAGTGVAFTVAGFAISYGSIIGAGISIAGSALLGAKKPKIGVSSTAAQDGLPLIDTGRKTNVNSPTDFRQIVYGQTRRSGVNLFAKTTSTGLNNKDARLSSRDSYLHIITAFAGHECTEFMQLYINDIPIDLDAEGWVTNARFTKNSDTEPEKAANSYAATVYTAGNATGSGTTATIVLDTAFATVSGFIGIGDLIQVQGFADTAYNGQFEVTAVADAGSSRTNVTYTTDIAITTSPAAQTSVEVDINPIGYRESVAYVYTSSGHGLNGGDQVFVFDADADIYNIDKVPVKERKTARTFTYRIADFQTPNAAATVASYQRRNGTDSALVNVQLFLGSNSQDISANSFIDEALRGQFVATDNMKGICCAYVRFYDASEFDESPQLTAEIKGKKVFDPRDGVVKYTNNAALCILDYLTGKINGVPYGCGYNLDTVGNTSTDINLENFKIEANRCDESIALSDGSFVKRYTIDGTLSTGEQFIDNLTFMCASVMGNLAIYDGKVHLWTAHYEIPTHHINEDWFAGEGLRISINNDKQSLINAAKGVINNEAELYNADDFPKYSDTAAIANDGEEFADDLQLPFVKNIESAQRLAKIYVKNAGKRMTLDCTLNARGLMLVPNDTVFLSFDRYNFVNKLFKVAKIQIDLQNLQVNVTFKEDDASVYEWTASEAQ